MISIKRYWMFLLLALVVVGSTASGSRADYVPQYVVGQWNGVWWHWCSICPEPGSPPYSAYATDTRMHGIGESCANKKDPLPIRIGSIKVLRFEEPKAEPIRENLAPNLMARQSKFVPLMKKAGKAGESEDPLDSFQLASASFSIADDKLVLIKDGSGNDRYFRLLLIKPADGVKIKDVAAELIGIGQELAPADKDGIADKAEWADFFGPQQIILKAKDTSGTDRVWHVSTMSRFKRP